MSVRVSAAVAGVCAFVALAASAHAGVTFVPYGTALPAGEKMISDFATLAGATGSAGLFTGSQSAVSAAPAFSAGTVDTASYLSVRTGKSETLAFEPSREISVYAGSLDSYNTITFGGPGGASFTGGQLASITGAADNGDQTAGSSNGRFVFDFSAPVTSVTFSSAGDTFEVASVAGTAVPEPAAWALMLIGLGGAGMSLRSRRRAIRPQAA